jgi:hypothetical protein
MKVVSRRAWYRPVASADPLCVVRLLFDRRDSLLDLEHIEGD